MLRPVRKGCVRYNKILRILRAYREDIGQSSLYALIFFQEKYCGKRSFAYAQRNVQLSQHLLKLR